MKFIEYFKLAFRNIRGNLLRTILTCLIIAFGIMALVGIQSAISALSSSAGDVFSSFGANQFRITNRAEKVEKNGERKINPPITITEARAFKSMFNFPSRVGISYNPRSYIEIKSSTAKTNPNASIFSGDENYFALENKKVVYGREFSASELRSGENVAIISPEIQSKLFKNKKVGDVIGKTVTAAGVKYRIIGIFEKKGGGFNSVSSFIFIPLESAVRAFGTPRTNYTIKIGVETEEQMKPAIDEAYGTMRSARKLSVTQANDFSIPNPNSAGEKQKQIINSISMGGLLIGIVTLTGAAIGLMNILLVSVTERVREIGISKAIGATAASVSTQYFIEGILISLMGGILGVLFGLSVGLIIAKLLKTTFQVPWNWVFIGMTICFVVGLLASIYPAVKASKLNPIEALRQN